MATSIKAFNPKDGIIFWVIALALFLFWLIGFNVCWLGMWSHLMVLLLALLAFAFGIHRGLRGSLNIDADRTYLPNWDPARPVESLKEIHDYAIDQAIKSMDWYWKHKGAKAFFSQTVRFFAWVLAAVSGILPIAASLYNANEKSTLHSPLVPSLLLGIAAALLGLDKAFGYSTGWARYVFTATNIRKILEQFRLDWAELMAQSGISAQAGNVITAAQVAPLIECAKQFSAEVENQVLQETNAWITEFQTNTAQMEKDIATQIANLKTQVDKTIAARTAASQPGTIQLTITDAGNRAANGGLQVTVLDSTNKTILQEPVTGLIWSSRFIAQGTYQLRLTLNNAPVGGTPLVTVASGASVTANITI